MLWETQVIWRLSLLFTMSLSSHGCRRYSAILQPGHWYYGTMMPWVIRWLFLLYIYKFVSFLLSFQTLSIWIPGEQVIVADTIYWHSSHWWGLFWEVGPPDPQSLEVTGTENANASTGPPGGVLSGATPSSTPRILSHAFYQVGALNHDFCCIREHCEPWRNLCYSFDVFFPGWWERGAFQGHLCHSIKLVASFGVW